MRVEVVYATAKEQVVIDVELSEGATVEQVIRKSGMLLHFTEIDLSTAAIGVFGERVALDDVVTAGDRVEIYRQLLADPKEARRRRAQRRKG